MFFSSIKKLYQPDPQKKANDIISSFPVAEPHPEPEPAADIITGHYNPHGERLHLIFSRFRPYNFNAEVDNDYPQKR